MVLIYGSKTPQVEKERKDALEMGKEAQEEDATDAEAQSR